MKPLPSYVLKSTQPQELDEISRRIKQLEIEREAIKRENDEVKLSSLSKEIADLKEEETRYKAKWEAEKAILANTNQQTLLEQDKRRLAEEGLFSSDIYLHFRQQLEEEVPHLTPQDWNDLQEQLVL